MSSLSIGQNVHNAHIHVKAKRTHILCKMHSMDYDDRPEPAKRLEKARISRGFSSARAACERFSWNYHTYAQHENGQRGIGRAANKYAEAYRVSEAWLLTGEGRGPGETVKEAKGLRSVEVIAHVQAGVWTESWEWETEDRYKITVPDDTELRHLSLFAAETRGPSMNLRYTEGTVLVFARQIEAREAIIPGKRYIIERRRASGEAEHTVKTLHRDDSGRYWLVPESDDPLFRAPIPLDDDVADGDTITILGRVRYAVSKE